MTSDHYKTDPKQTMLDWWETPLGRYVLTQEQARIQSLVKYFHGYYQLQIGTEQRLLPQLNKPSIQKVVARSGDVNADSTALPFKCHSVDTLLLSHVLEFVSDPHQVLREADRILVADGTLVLCRFNPWSLWGLKRLLSWQDNPPWHGSFFSYTRIKDWLALLNFEVIAMEKLLFTPPLKNEKTIQRFNFLDRWGKRLWPVFSGVTILVATKRTIPMTPITNGWRYKRLFPRPLVQNPARETINDRS